MNICIGENFSEENIHAWSQWGIENQVLGVLKIDVYIKCIPESEIGAIESIMLDALGTDLEEKNLIEESKKFINHIATIQKRYLQKKSRLCKAVFNTYFSIRAPEEKSERIC